MPYVGALDSYVYGLSFALFGVDVQVFRLTNVLISLLILAFAYSLARELGGRAAGALAGFLLAVDLEFLLRVPTNNQGPILLQLLASTIAVLMIYRSMTQGSSWRLALGCFFLGVGLSEKLTFLLFLPSFAIAACLFYGRSLIRLLDPRSFSLAVAAFCLGSAPVIAFFVSRPEIILQFGEGKLHSPDWGMILQKRFFQFERLLTEMSMIRRQLGENPVDFARFNVVWWLIWIACALVAVSVVYRLVQRRPPVNFDHS